jgi:preprotein translocase subunit SecB
MAKDKTAAPAAEPQAAPTLNLLSQYIRDLSFENPNAPASILNNTTSPSISININTQVKKQEDEVYAVELTLNAKAERDADVLFNVELVYGGVFKIGNVPENQLPPWLMIECPRLLFPFARQILANVTQSGGFPPIMMEPVDFAAIYRQNLAAMAQQQTDGAAPKPN